MFGAEQPACLDEARRADCCLLLPRETRGGGKAAESHGRGRAHAAEPSGSGPALCSSFLLVVLPLTEPLICAGRGAGGRDVTGPTSSMGLREAT